MLRTRLATVLAALFPAALSGATAVAADVLVGVEVPANRRVSLDQIDHSAWDQLLKTYVNDRGQVDYRGWHASAEAIQQLDQYLAILSTGDTDGRASREAKLAYWINAYNAVTVKGILREYPTTSIRNHTAKLWGYNIWKNLKLKADGRTPSLNDIEHEILRPMGDPRIHFAIVCASVGCPRLLNEAYVADRLDGQLEGNAEHFFAQSQNFQVNRLAKRVSLSSILSWFGEDFGDSETAILKRISPWLPSDAARRLAADPGVRVSYLDYDWDLNSQ
ncbi:MAG: DUF547 domain-containing protein [Planctomycetota bacterium]